MNLFEIRKSAEHPGYPNPERRSNHEEQDTERQRGGTRPFIQLVLITDDDTRESGRQGTGQDHHLQLVALHMEQLPDYE